MIIVDDFGGIFPAINHSPWDGATLADFVMPFFLFIVGVALALAYKVLILSFLPSYRRIMHTSNLVLSSILN